LRNGGILEFTVQFFQTRWFRFLYSTSLVLVVVYVVIKTNLCQTSISASSLEHKYISRSPCILLKITPTEKCLKYEFVGLECWYIVCMLNAILLQYWSFFNNMVSFNLSFKKKECFILPVRLKIKIMLQMFLYSKYQIYSKWVVFEERTCEQSDSVTTLFWSGFIDLPEMIYKWRNCYLTHLSSNKDDSFVLLLNSTKLVRIPVQYILKWCIYNLWAKMRMLSLST
jgi:hypothetical protein